MMRTIQRFRNRGNPDLNVRTASWTSALPLYERSSPLADLFKRHFESVKFFRAQFREHSLHLRRNDEILAARGEGNHPNAPVFGALDPADQALRYEAIDSDTDRPWGQVEDWAYRIDGQRPFVQTGDDSLHALPDTPCQMADDLSRIWHFSNEQTPMDQFRRK